MPHIFELVFELEQSEICNPLKKQNLAHLIALSFVKLLALL